MSDQPTMRTHLEAIPELINQNRLLKAKEYAVAALNLLDEADVMGPGSIFTGKIEHITHRLVADPEGRS